MKLMKLEEPKTRVCWMRLFSLSQLFLPAPFTMCIFFFNIIICPVFFLNNYYSKKKNCRVLRSKLRLTMSTIPLSTLRWQRRGRYTNRLSGKEEEEEEEEEEEAPITTAPLFYHQINWNRRRRRRRRRKKNPLSLLLKMFDAPNMNLFSVWTISSLL